MGSLHPAILKALGHLLWLWRDQLQKLMWGRVIQTDMVTWPFKVGSYDSHIMCKKDEGIVIPNFIPPVGARVKPQIWPQVNRLASKGQKGSQWSKRFEIVLSFLAITYDSRKLWEQCLRQCLSLVKPQRLIYNIICPKKVNLWNLFQPRPWPDLENSFCISVDFFAQDKRIAGSLKPVAHPNQKLLLKNCWLVAFDDVIWPEMHAAEANGQK